MKTLTDRFGRIHDYVRLSLTDKCNLNCLYCNPKNSGQKQFANSLILTADEIIRLTEILVKNLEVRKIRFTGGEPLIRPDILTILDGISPLKSEFPLVLGLTTNGTGLKTKIPALKACGIDNLNISLDTLNDKRFLEMTGKNLFSNTFDSIQEAIHFNFKAIKINAVIIKEINDDELINFVDYFKNEKIELRFIEFMPFSSNEWAKDGFISSEEMKKVIETKFSLTRLTDENKIAKNYTINGYPCKIGFISSISDHFCSECNRLRITATGKIKTCLFAPESNYDLKSLLSDMTVSDESIAATICTSLLSKHEKHPEIDELTTLHSNNMLSIGG